jgi:hypothetical protein
VGRLHQGSTWVRLEGDRDRRWAKVSDYTAPFRFTGGSIDKVVVDVSGEPYLDHVAQVRGWFSID